MKELGIYIHIPFCKQKCFYCDFISYANKECYIEKYIDSLINEIKRVDNCIVNTIYIGGGTPSYIESKYIRKIIDKIRNEFEIAQNVEITIEVNPGTVNEQKLKNYFDIGINRLSIGLQTSKDNLLKQIGRIHKYQEFLDTYKNARKVGFKNINIDLMLGLPNQTMKDLDETLEKIIGLNPEHISVYSLIVEENTIMKSKIENNELELPDEDIERKMYWKVKEKLETSKYIHYEISNFAKQGYESKHNLNCWNQNEYIGYGIAAHSYFDSKRYCNTSNIEEYIKNIQENQISKNKEICEIQQKEDKMKEYMLLGLRKIQGVNINKFKNKFIDNPIYIFRKELQELVEENLIEIDLDNIKLTNRGLDLANVAWEKFI